MSRFTSPHFSLFFMGERIPEVFKIVIYIALKALLPSELLNIKGGNEREGERRSDFWEYVLLLL